MFKITIQEIKTIKRMDTKWEKVGEKEVARDIAFYEKTQDEPRTRIEAIYGYTPPKEVFIEEERDILIQEVEELDLAAVIKAINNLS